MNPVGSDLQNLSCHSDKAQLQLTSQSSSRLFHLHSHAISP